MVLGFQGLAALLGFGAFGGLLFDLLAQGDELGFGLLQGLVGGVRGGFLVRGGEGFELLGSFGESGDFFFVDCIFCFGGFVGLEG